MESQTRHLGGHNTKESKIPLEVRYLGACILAASNGGDMRRAVDQADEGADLYEEAWLRRKEKRENQAIDSAAKTIRIAKNWSLGIQHITGESRRDRAEKKFEQYLQWRGVGDSIILSSPVWDTRREEEVLIERNLSDWRERGFLVEELEFLKKEFDRFKRNRFTS